ncbi:hypothetical protein E1N66_18095 [Pantoea allii]|nr:hypothetical protein [Pantoea allii]THB82986.1 hypothetical protein E1N66_18095 [Pantoea allii]
MTILDKASGDAFTKTGSRAGNKNNHLTVPYAIFNVDGFTIAFHFRFCAWKSDPACKRILPSYPLRLFGAVCTLKGQICGQQAILRMNNVHPFVSQPFASTPQTVAKLPEAGFVAQRTLFKVILLINKEFIAFQFWHAGCKAL